MSNSPSVPPLPDYVAIKNPSDKSPSILRAKAATLEFPLSIEDQESVRILEAKYDQEENCAGLAAPQIGISKRIIIFAVEADENLKKWRPDISDTMPKTIWINPTYSPLSSAKHVDYEACFSVEDVAAPIARYKGIHYAAYTPEGKRVEGAAHGFLARLIQHEIDHLNGILFTDLAAEKDILPMEEYREKRRKAMEAND